MMKNVMGKKTFEFFMHFGTLRTFVAFDRTFDYC